VKRSPTADVYVFRNDSVFVLVTRPLLLREHSGTRTRRGHTSHRMKRNHVGKSHLRPILNLRRPRFDCPCGPVAPPSTSGSAHWPRPSLLGGVPCSRPCNRTTSSPRSWGKAGPRRRPVQIQTERLSYNVRTCGFHARKPIFHSLQTVVGMIDFIGPYGETSTLCRFNFAYTRVLREKTRVAKTYANRTRYDINCKRKPTQEIDEAWAA